MNSKRSFFNKTIFRKNVSRFWPVWAFYTVVLFFTLVFPAYVDLSKASAQRLDGGLSFSGLSAIQSPLLIVWFALLAAGSVYSFLFNTRDCYMMHAFPVSRDELYFTNYVSGLLFLFVPNILMVLAAVPGMKMLGFHLRTEIVPALCYTLAICFILYTLAVLCCMISGHLLGMWAYFWLINLFYVTASTLVSWLVAFFGYGLEVDTAFLNNPLMVLSPIWFLTGRTGPSYRAVSDTVTDIAGSDLDVSHYAVTYRGIGILLCYLACSLVLIGIGRMLYQKRQLETAGEISAFVSIKPFTRWIIGICGGLGFAYVILLVFGIYDESSRGSYLPYTLAFILFCFIWFFVTEMILNKSFRVFGKARLREWAAGTAVICLLLFGLRTYTVHVISARVPDSSEVTAAVVQNDYPYLAETETDIDQVIALHQAAISEESAVEVIRNTSDSPEDSIRTVAIAYQLKNGKTVSRSYSVADTEDSRQNPSSGASLLQTLMADSTPLTQQIGTNYDSISFRTLDVYDRTLTEDAAMDVYAAVLEDYREQNFPYMKQYGNGYTDQDGVLDLTFTARTDGQAQTLETELQRIGAESLSLYIHSSILTPPDISVKKNKDGSYTTETTACIPIFRTCTHTIDALKRHGISVTDGDFALSDS